MTMNQPPSTVHQRSIALATTLYRWLLVIYPASFRQRYGASMLQVFRDSCRAADRAAGRRGLVAFWLPTLADLFKTALAEWLTIMRLLVRPVTLRVCGLLTLLSALGALLLFVLPSLLWELGLPSYFAWPRGREWFERSELLWDALVLCCFLFGMCGVLLVQRTRSGRVIGSLTLLGWVGLTGWDDLSRWLFFSQNLVRSFLLGDGSLLLIVAGLIGCGVHLYRPRQGAFWSSLPLLLGLCLALDLAGTIIEQLIPTSLPPFSYVWLLGYVLWAGFGWSLLIRKEAPGVSLQRATS